MAQKAILKLTARKIVNPRGSTVFDGGPAVSGGTTKDITLVLWGTSAVVYSVPSRTGSAAADDSLIMTSDGWQVTILQEYADVATALSATDLTNS